MTSKGTIDSFGSIFVNGVESETDSIEIEAPENKVFLNTSYFLQTNFFGELAPSVCYSWVDERQFTMFNNDVSLSDDYCRLDAMLTWFSPKKGIRVIASWRSLTEEET